MAHVRVYEIARNYPGFTSRDVYEMLNESLGGIFVGRDFLRSASSDVSKDAPIFASVVADYVEYKIGLVNWERALMGYAENPYESTLSEVKSNV